MRITYLIDRLEPRKLLSVPGAIFDWGVALQAPDAGTGLTQTGTNQSSPTWNDSLVLDRPTGTGSIDGAVTAELHATSTPLGGNVSAAIVTDNRYEHAADGWPNRYLSTTESRVTFTVWLLGQPGTRYQLISTFGERRYTNFGHVFSNQTSATGHGTRSATGIGSFVGAPITAPPIVGQTIGVTRTFDGAVYSQVETPLTLFAETWVGNSGPSAPAGTYGAFQSTSFSVAIQNLDGLPPVSRFDGPETVTAGQPATFTSTSFDPDEADPTIPLAGIVSHTWNLDDSTQPATSDERQSAITYSNLTPGSHKVTLTVLDNDGRTASMSKRVIVVEPDLTVIAIAYTPEPRLGEQNLAAGADIPVTSSMALEVRVTNSGSGSSAPTTASISLSTDSTVGNGDDLRFHSFDIPQLSAGQTFTYQATGILFPGQLEAASPYAELRAFAGTGKMLGVVVDANNIVRESNESNNSRTTRIRLMDPFYPNNLSASNLPSRAAAEDWLRSRGFSGEIPLDSGWSLNWSENRFSFYTGKTMPAAFFRVQASIGFNSSTGTYSIVTQGPEPSPRFFLSPNNLWTWGMDLYNYVRRYHLVY